MHSANPMRAILCTAVLALLLPSCKSKSETEPAPAPEATLAAPKDQAEPAMAPLHPNNIVSIAIASKDHTTLVAALKAADYVTAVSGSGPLTVFAPTNAAFDALPPGTLDDLVRPEKQAELKEIIKYHATTSAYDAKNLKDGQVLGMANGAKATIHITDGKMMINDANVLATIPAENGVVHVIDKVLLPPAK